VIYTVTFFIRGTLNVLLNKQNAMVCWSAVAGLLSSAGKKMSVFRELSVVFSAISFFDCGAASNNMQNLAITNALVAASNVVGLLPLLQANTTTQALIAIMAVSASTLMHLSERKHGLPGIAPFSKWSTAFLWFDRMVALGAGGYVACKFARNMCAIPWELVLIGLPALALSEHVEGGPVWFATTHSAWHISALQCLYKKIRRFAFSARLLLALSWCFCSRLLFGTWFFAHQQR
jgi:hypothetical protein